MPANKLKPAFLIRKINLDNILQNRALNKMLQKVVNSDNISL